VEFETLNLTGRDRKFLLEAEKVVCDHLSERDFGVASFCQLLGISRVTLHRRLKHVLGLPASEFIRDLRLDHAAELIREGKLNVRQAANASGFYNMSYFSKCFRKRFGVRPSEFRSRQSLVSSH
jgi:AraC-like DNA-binding protein